MKTFQTFILGLFLISLSQTSFCITDADVYSFGEDDTFFYPTSKNSERDRLLNLYADQRRASRAQVKISQPARTLSTSNPIVIIQQQSNSPANKNVITQSPDSVWGLLAYFSISSKSTPDIK